VGTHVVDVPDVATHVADVVRPGDTTDSGEAGEAYVADGDATGEDATGEDATGAAAPGEAATGAAATDEDEADDAPTHLADVVPPPLSAVRPTFDDILAPPVAGVVPPPAPGAPGATDAATATDAADSTRATDATGVTDGTGATDSTRATDAPGAADSTRATDEADATSARDATDAPTVAVPEQPRAEPAELTEPTEPPELAEPAEQADPTGRREPAEQAEPRDPAQPPAEGEDRPRTDTTPTTMTGLFARATVDTSPAPVQPASTPEGGAEEPPTTTTLQAIARRRWTRGLMALAACLTLLAGVGFGAGVVHNWLNRPPSVVALDEINEAPDVRSATVVMDGGLTATAYWSAEQGKAVLVSEGLPSIPDDETFEMWLIRDDDPTSAGTFTAEAGSRATSVLEGEVQPGDVIAVTVEPAGGAPAGVPTSDPIVAVPTA